MKFFLQNIDVNMKCRYCLVVIDHQIDERHHSFTSIDLPASRSEHMDQMLGPILYSEKFWSQCSLSLFFSSKILFCLFCYIKGDNLLRCHNIQHNDNQHNDTQHNDTQHNDTQHNDIQHNNKKTVILSIIVLLSVFYAECHVCLVSQVNPWCWMSLCWM